MLGYWSCFRSEDEERNFTACGVWGLAVYCVGNPLVLPPGTQRANREEKAPSTLKLILR